MDETNRKRSWHVVAYVLFGLCSGLGCMSFNLGNTYERSFPSSYVDSSGLLRQHDETTIPKTSDNHYTIHYPRPFAGKPHLKLLKTDDSLNPKDVEIVEQFPDRFTIRWTGGGSEPMVAWQAEGLPNSPSPAPTPTVEPKAITPVNGER